LENFVAEAAFARERKRACSGCRINPKQLNYCSTTGNELEYQRDYGQHQQNVNETSQCVATHHAQQPQHQKNYEKCPKHRFTPFVVSLANSTLNRFLELLGWKLLRARMVAGADNFPSE
jgi:hypothetical protein